MFNKLHIVLLVLSLVAIPIFGQDADTTDFEEEGPKKVQGACSSSLPMLFRAAEMPLLGVLLKREQDLKIALETLAGGGPGAASRRPRWG